MAETAGERLVSNVLALLKERGWKKAELARRSGISPQFLGDVLDPARNTGIQMIDKLAAAFGLSPAALLADKDERSALQLSTSLDAPQIPSWQSSLTAETLKRTIDERIDQRLETSRAPQTAQPKGAAGEILELLSGLPESDAVAVSGVVRKMVERAKSQTKKRSDTG